MRQHELFKRLDGRIECKICQTDWSKKPSSLCPGCIRYGWGCQPPHVKSLVDLNKQNLKPKKGAKPSGCYYSQKNDEWTWLYDEKDCELDDSDLPPIIQWEDAEKLNLKTIGQLKKINLAPNEEASPRAVAWVWDRDEEWGKWIPLYHEDDCRWNPKDTWISKFQLQKIYLLSRGWIKQLGEPDRELVNLRYPNGPTIKLYSRQRVEKFLADNAQKYAEWLDKRDKYLTIFEANKDKIFAKRNAVKEQTQRCLKCVSGCSSPQGFLCAIHPLGLLDLPCLDFQERAEEIVNDR